VPVGISGLLPSSASWLGIIKQNAKSRDLTIVSFLGFWGTVWSSFFSFPFRVPICVCVYIYHLSIYPLPIHSRVFSCN
jgi:hypothetical protein